jgi:hypothetical protein
VWGATIAVFIVCMVVAQPLNVWTGLQFLSPVSEVFTSPVSATFVAGASGLTNVTTTTYFPNNGSTVVSWALVNLNLGYGTITLSGKGSLSVDNELTESVRWLVPKSLEDALLPNATITFHTVFSDPVNPEYDEFGVPLVGNITLEPRGVLTLKNGTVWGEQWKGSGVVTFVESGDLGSLLVFTNILGNTSAGKPPQAVTLNGEVPEVIEIGAEESTSTVRNNDWVITLTFAILLFAVLDLGSYEKSQNGETDQGKEQEHDTNGGDTSRSRSADAHEQGKHENQSRNDSVLHTKQPTSEATKGGHSRALRWARIRPVLLVTFTGLIIVLLSIGLVFYAALSFGAWYLMISYLLFFVISDFLQTKLFGEEGGRLKIRLKSPFYRLWGVQATVFAFVALGGAMLASFTGVFTTKVLIPDSGSNIILFILLFTVFVLSLFTAYFYGRSSGRI